MRNVNSSAPPLVGRAAYPIPKHFATNAEWTLWETSNASCKLAGEFHNVSVLLCVGVETTIILLQTAIIFAPVPSATNASGN